MSAPVLQVRALVKRFTLHNIGGRQVEALRGIDLDVHTGEHVALAGTSGAGKSTLLKCVYRTYRSQSGSVLLRRSDGSTIDLAEASDQQIAATRGSELGYVSQFLRADPRRAALDVVARAAQFRGVDAALARDAAADALRRLNIAEELWSHYPSVLSGGERQRVNLAAGIVVPPRLLLLDEPVSALDPANREAVLAMIGELSGNGVAVLGVFHDLDAMARLADRVVVLDHGAIGAQGSPAEVLGADRLAGVAR